jgi:hypothetical protein
MGQLPTPILIPELTMYGAAIASTISHTMTAALTLLLYRRTRMA